MSWSEKEFAKRMKENPQLSITEEWKIGASYSEATEQTTGRPGRAKKTVRFGLKFDSAGEADRHGVLLLQQRAGLISNLKVKPTFELLPASTSKINGRIRARTWEADWSYTLPDGTEVVEDYKGYKYRSWRDKLSWIKRAVGDRFLFVNDDVNAICETTK